MSDFRSSPSPDRPAAERTTVRAYLQLVRAPNVFTAMADILLGYLFTHEQLQRWPLFASLLAASTLLYLSGMVLNDYFDREVDARERPERPIPSGHVAPATALRLGLTMLLGGTALAWLTSAVAGECASGADRHAVGRRNRALRRLRQEHAAGAAGDGSLPVAQRAVGNESLDRALAGDSLGRSRRRWPVYRRRNRVCSQRSPPTALAGSCCWARRFCWPASAC